LIERELFIAAEFNLKMLGHTDFGPKATALRGIDGGYDTIAAVEGSGWVEELTSAQTKEWRGHFAMHHYMLYIDSSGCYEVVAASWSLLPDVQKHTLRLS
jgi:hypothetical protein